MNNQSVGHKQDISLYLRVILSRGIITSYGTFLESSFVNLLKINKKGNLLIIKV